MAAVLPAALDLEALFEPTTETLYAEFEDARAAFPAGEGTATRYRETFQAWFRQSCAEGRAPDALRSTATSIDERIEERTVSGADHDYWTGAFAGANPRVHFAGRDLAVRRYLYERAYGVTLDRYRQTVRPTCGERKCVRLDHLELQVRDRQLLSDSTLLGAIQVRAMRLGRTPTRVEWEAEKWSPSAATIYNRFGSWTDAIRAAGLQPERQNLPRISRDEAIQALQALGRDLGRVPVAGEVRDRPGVPSLNTLRRIFGSFNAAIEAAGMEPSGVTPIRNLTPEKVAAAIAEKAREIGHPPTRSEWTKNVWRPVTKAVLRQFDSWADALEAAGLS